jgi:signal transduction histidine kinase/CheY-like chemotaxis protein
MKKERQHISWLIWCFVVLLVALLTVCSGMFYNSMKKLLYEERQDHLSELTIKISEILNTRMQVMQEKADTAQNLINIGAQKEYSGLAEMLEEIQNVIRLDNGELIAINSKSIFYTSSGYYARWSTPEDLSEDDGIPMIRELTFHGTKDTYLIFLRALDAEAAFDDDGVELTHVIVAIPLSNMEDDFSITGFGGNCFTYLINSSGRRLYKQTFSNTFIEEFNVLSALRDYEFSEDGDIEVLSEAIANQENACMEFKVPDTKDYYFVSTVPIEDTDWAVLVFVPTAVLGSNSNKVMASLLWYFVIILVIIAGILILLLNLNYRRVSARQLLEQQEENNKLLEEAADQAARANDAKTDFLTHISHDIRTPINGIVGMVSIARKNLSNPVRLEDCLNKIGRSSDHMISLINDVLEMSRIESGRIDINRRPVNIGTIADNCSSIIDSQLLARNIEFRKEFGEISHKLVLGDELRLRQIFINVLGNAVKFTQDGGCIIFRMKEVEGTEQAADFQFEIEDNGIGMSEEFVGHIFEPFSQENGGSRTDYPGAGLGMAITKEYVELMGGSISVQSRPGDGTVVRIEMSFEAVQNEKKPSENPGQFELEGMSVLLVEDNELNMEIAQEILNDAGIRVVTASDGKEAVEIFEDSAWDSFDAILMDVMMPNMNGYEATRAIRSGPHPKGATIPIIAMTANAYVEDIAAALSSGMNAHVPKPIDVNYLFGVLNQYYHAD